MLTSSLRQTSSIFVLRASIRAIESLKIEAMAVSKGLAPGRLVCENPWIELGLPSEDIAPAACRRVHRRLLQTLSVF